MLRWNASGDMSLSETVRREHRTNQQLFAPEIFRILQRWAEDYSSGNYDARNEAICRVANALVDNFADHEIDETTRNQFASLVFPYI